MQRPPGGHDPGGGKSRRSGEVRSQPLQLCLGHRTTHGQLTKYSLCAFLKAIARFQNERTLSSTPSCCAAAYAESSLFATIHGPCWQLVKPACGCWASHYNMSKDNSVRRRFVSFAFERTRHTGTGKRPLSRALMRRSRMISLMSGSASPDSAARAALILRI